MGYDGESLEFVVYESFAKFLDVVVYVFITLEPSKSCAIDRLTVWIPVFWVASKS